MKFTAFIATAILAYATMATAIPMPEKTATAIGPVDVTYDMEMDTADIVDIVKRDAEADARRRSGFQDNGWGNRPGQKVKREAEAEADAEARRRSGFQDNGWGNRPGQKIKREAEADAEARRRSGFQDNGWGNRPGQKVKREAEAEAEADARRRRSGFQDNGWGNRPGQ